MQRVATMVRVAGLAAVAAALVAVGSFLADSSEPALAADPDPTGVLCIDISVVGVPASLGEGIGLIRIDGTTASDVDITAVSYTPDGGAPEATCTSLGSLPQVPFAHQNANRPTISGAVWTAGTNNLAGFTCEENFVFAGATFANWTKISFNVTFNKVGTTSQTNAFSLRTNQNPGANPPATCTDTGSSATINANISNGTWLDGPGGSTASFNSDWDGGGVRDWDELDPALTPNIAMDPFNDLDDTYGGGIGGVAEIAGDTDVAPAQVAGSSGGNGTMIAIVTASVLAAMTIGAGGLFARNRFATRSVRD